MIKVGIVKHQTWFMRIKDLVDKYNPDLFYTDGAVSFGNEYGLSLIAHYYNSDLKRNGKTPVVYTCKQRSNPTSCNKFYNLLLFK